MDQNSDIDAWRRVHRQLTMALIQSRDNIAAELTKRRYLLEEMNRCKMQSAQKSAHPGSSGSSTKTKKKAAPKKAQAQAPSVAIKVKQNPPSTYIPPKPNTSAPATATPHEADGVVNQALMASIVAPLHPPTTVMGSDKGTSYQNKDDHSKEDDDDDDTDDILHPNPQYAGIAPQQMYFPPAYGMHGMELATPEQMGLAFQMMQHMNQPEATEEDGETEEKTQWA